MTLPGFTLGAAATVGTSAGVAAGVAAADVVVVAAGRGTAVGWDVAGAAAPQPTASKRIKTTPEAKPLLQFPLSKGGYRGVGLRLAKDRKVTLLAPLSTWRHPAAH